MRGSSSDKVSQGLATSSPSTCDGTDDHRPDIRYLLTTQQAAHALSVSRTTLYQLMGSGDLGFVLIGRARRIPVRAVHRFVERQMQRQGFQP